MIRKISPSVKVLLGGAGLLLSAGFALPAHGATITWDGGGTTITCGLGLENNTTCGANWDTDSAPGSDDLVIFPSGTKSATINSSFNVAGIDIQDGFTNTITQAATVTVGSQGLSQAAGTFTGASQAIDINGNFTLTGGTFAATSGTFTVSGNWAKTGGTFTSGANTVTFDSSGTQTINSGGTDTGSDFQNITKSNSGTLQLATNAIDIDGTLTVSSGTMVDLNSKNLTAATLDNPGTLLLEGGETVAITTFDSAEGTVTYDGTSSYTGLAAGDAYYNLTFNGSGGTWTLDAALDANNTLTITAGTLDASTSNYGITLAGNWDNSGSFTERSGTVTFDGSAAQTLTGETFYNLTVNNSAASPSDTVDVDSSAAVTVTNTLTIADGQFQPTTASDFAAVTIETNGILKPDASATLTVSGNWANSGVFTSNSGTVNFDASSGTQTINAGGTGNANKDFDNLTKSGGGTLQLVTTALEVDGTLTISSSTTVDLNGQNLTLATLDNSGTFLLEGAETVSITTLDTNSGTVTYDGTTSYASGLVAGDAYYNLTFNGSGGSWILDAALDVNNTLTITAGTLDVKSGSDYAVTAGGNWSNSGTFTARSGTVTLDGTDQTLSGTTTFNNLTKSVTSAATLTFPASTTTTVSGTTTLNGASGQLLSLRSSTSSTAATIANSGTTTVSYLDIKDITLTVTVSCDTGCIDSGNNTLWTFPGGGGGSSGASAAASSSENGLGVFYSKDGSDTAPLTIEQGVKDKDSEERIIAARVDRPLELSAHPVDPGELREIYIRVNGQKIPLTPSDNGETYVTSVRLPANTAGAYAYAMTADYGFTTRTVYGKILVKKLSTKTKSARRKVTQVAGAATTRLASYVNPLFKKVHHREPSTSERSYWEKRVEHGDKDSPPALLGAIQWQQLYAN